MSIATQPLALPRGPYTLVRDYAELTKLRVTTLVVMTAWCGYYFGAIRAGVSSLSWGLFHTLLGIGLVAGGTAALNEVMESDVDRHMRRTAGRPLPTGRMSTRRALVSGVAMALGGALYLSLALNPLTGLLSVATAVVYLGAYTPLKKIHPICTFVGAFPGAMPGVLGWTAARAGWNGARWPCSPSFSFGSFRISFLLPGSIAKTMRRARSACCRWSK